jgi:hypothetical protein
MTDIPIQKTVYTRDSFSRVVDTQFNQLIQTSEEEIPTFTVDDFFELYEQLFYQIPKEGDSNSHQYILQREADYLGISIGQDDVQALLDEITSLRQQILDTQTTVNELTKATSNT